MKIVRRINVFACCLLFFLSGSLQAQETAVPAVTVPQDLLKTLRKEHPRLLATTADFKTLKQRIETDATLRDWYAQVAKQGDKILSESPSKYEIPDGLRLLRTSRLVVERITTLGMLYQLTRDEKYGQRAWQELAAAATFPNWNPKHFLDVAEMTYAFAIGYDWLYDYWSPDQREIIKSALVEKGLNRALLAYEGLAKQSDGWWTKVEHNWNQVCNGGIGMGALAVADEEPKLANAILQHAIQNLPYAMKSFAPDGAWNEGPGYWGYTTRYNIAILAGLKSALGTDFGLSDIEGFSKTGLFPLYLTGPFNLAFNYADAGGGPAGGSQLFWLADQYKQVQAAKYQKQLTKRPSAFDLLWYPADLVGQHDETLPLAAYFRFAEVVSMRSAWNDPKAWFVGFKAGDNKANHSNLDLGSFVLDALGKRWVVDLGAENYNLPGYFNTGAQGTRWTYYRMRAEGHNTVVLNPGQGADQNPQAAAKITKFVEKGTTSFAIADLTPAYATEAQSLRRGIALVAGNAVVIQDEVKAHRPSEFYWFMHTPAAITLSKNGRRAVLTLDGEQLEAEILSPAQATFSELPASPLASSPQPAGINKNEGIRRLTVHLKAVQDERVIVEIRPVGKKGSGTKAFQKALNEW